MNVNNQVTLIGRLSKSPELKFTGTGKAVTTFSLAVDRGFTNQEGNKEADFINIVCWNKTAENVANNLDKGRLVAVMGAIRTRNYDGNDGKKVYVTEVVAEEVKFLDWPNDSKKSDKQDKTKELEDRLEDMGFSPVENSEEIPF